MKKQDIQPIYADSTNKNESYRLLNMIHSMAGLCALNKVDQWNISFSYTSDHYAITTWTNGIVDITAISVNDVHCYSMIQCED